MIDWRPVVDDREDTADELPPLGARRARAGNQTVRELPFLLGLAILIAFLFKTFVAQAFYIPSESMVPQLLIGDRVVVSKVSYRLHDPRRGDVLVFDDPHPADTEDTAALPVRVVRGVLEAVGLRQPSTDEFIKRVVGLPGETVEGRNGRVYVNGRELVEPYLPPGVTTSDFEPVTLRSDQLWMMGDNRDRSLDSRSFGPIKKSTIVGRAIGRAWPPGRVAFL